MNKKSYNSSGHGVHLSAVDKVPKHMELIIKPSKGDF